MLLMSLSQGIVLHFRMREWLSGGASPSQGEGCEFESRFPLQSLCVKKPPNPIRRLFSILTIQFYLSRIDSYINTVAAIATFRESTVPCIGIRTAPAPMVYQSLCRPYFSLPTTSAVLSA